MFICLCREELLRSASVLQLDPAVNGVFNGPYPFGIDPVSSYPFITSEHLLQVSKTRINCIFRVYHNFDMAFFFFSDLEHSNQQAYLLKFVQDENVCCPGCHTYAFWGHPQLTKPYVRVFFLIQ